MAHMSPRLTPRGDLWPTRYLKFVGGGALVERNSLIMSWWREAHEHDESLDGTNLPQGITVRAYLMSPHNTLNQKLELVAFFVFKAHLFVLFIRSIRMAVNDHDGVPRLQRGEIPDEHLVKTPRFLNTCQNMWTALKDQVFRAQNCIPGADMAVPPMQLQFNFGNLALGAPEPPGPAFDISGNALAMAPHVAASSLHVRGLVNPLGGEHPRALEVSAATTGIAPPLPPRSPAASSM